MKSQCYYRWHNIGALFLSAKHTPFNIQFLTDHIEMQNEAKVDNNGSPKTGSGFQLAFFMRASDC